MSWRDTVLRLMRVPHTPTPPPGASPKVFRAAPNFFTLRVLRWALTQLLAIAGVVVAIVVFTRFDEYMPRYVRLLVQAGEAFAIAALVFEGVVGWTIVRLDYELRWYMVSDRAIRIREGIATIREKTIALANIQNISIRQGPLQRLLGIADVEVRTAGGGGGTEAGPHGQRKPGTEPMHMAYFRGVDNAATIRDLLREAVRHHRDAGLGDLEEPQHLHEPGDALVAAREVLLEAQRLRASATTG
jgi:membrane protein YdbS with pleckstrin-like domain